MNKPKLNYTNQDYSSILNELITAMKDGTTGLTTRWSNMSEADPLFLMLHLFAAHKDMENFMIDYRLNESFMSTARERASMVRIANSFGYKIPSYRTSSAVYRLDNLKLDNVQVDEGTAFTIPHFTTFVDASTGKSYAYIGADVNTLPVVHYWDSNNKISILLFEGIVQTHQFTPSTIEVETKTHIISNQSISIGAAMSSSRMLSKLVQSSSPNERVFREVPNLLEYIGADVNVYELNVDPQGITYIRFHQNAQILADAPFTLTYIITSGSQADAPASLSTSGILDLSNNQLSGSLVLIEDTETIGLDPANESEIKADFAAAMNNSKTLLRLEEVYNYIVNIQKINQNIAKVGVFDDVNEVIDGEAAEHGISIDTSDAPYELFVVFLDKFNIPINDYALFDDLDEKIVMPYTMSMNPTLTVNTDNIPTGKELIDINLTFNSGVNLNNSTFNSGVRLAIRRYVSSQPLGKTITQTDIRNALRDEGYSYNVYNDVIVRFRPKGDTTKDLPSYKAYPNRATHIESADAGVSIILHKNGTTW